MKTFIVGGIEGGATHSNAVLLNADGEIISKAMGPGTNHHLIGMDECRKRINDMINDAKDLAGIPQDTPIDALGLSLSGCEHEQSNNEIVLGLEKKYPNLSRKYTIGSDTEGSVAAISNKGGIVCIAGTGSNTLLINPDGSRRQCGGWGYILGDEGSAWRITLMGIKYCFDTIDDFEPAPYPIDRIWDEVKSYLKVESQAELLPYFYQNYDKAFLAKLCKQFADLALDGDLLSQHIFFCAGKDLASSIASVLKKTSNELVDQDGGIHVLCVGSVWLSWKLLKCGFTDHLRSHSTVEKISLVKLTTSSSVGAALMASDKLQIPIKRDYTKNYEAFYTYQRNQI